MNDLTFIEKSTKLNKKGVVNTSPFYLIDNKFFDISHV